MVAMSFENTANLKIFTMCAVVLASLMGAVPPILQAPTIGGDPAEVSTTIYLMRAFTVMHIDMSPIQCQLCNALQSIAYAGLTSADACRLVS